MSGCSDFELGFGRSATRPSPAPAAMRLLLSGDSEPVAQAMLEADMTPLLSHRNAATVLRPRSAARSARALAGLTGGSAGGALA